MHTVQATEACRWLRPFEIVPSNNTPRTNCWKIYWCEIFNKTFSHGFRKDKGWLVNALIRPSPQVGIITISIDCFFFKLLAALNGYKRLQPQRHPPPNTLLFCWYHNNSVGSLVHSKSPALSQFLGQARGDHLFNLQNRNSNSYRLVCLSSVTCKPMEGILKLTTINLFLQWLNVITWTTLFYKTLLLLIEDRMIILVNKSDNMLDFG